MGLRNLTDIPAELAARITPLDVGQTSELIEVRDGIHVVKLLGAQKYLSNVHSYPQYQTRHILDSTNRSQ